MFLRVSFFMKTILCDCSFPCRRKVTCSPVTMTLISTKPNRKRKSPSRTTIPRTRRRREAKPRANWKKKYENLNCATSSWCEAPFAFLRIILRTHVKYIRSHAWAASLTHGDTYKRTLSEIIQIQMMWHWSNLLRPC